MCNNRMLHRTSTTFEAQRAFDPHAQHASCVGSCVLPCARLAVPRRTEPRRRIAIVSHVYIDCDAPGGVILSLGIMRAHHRSQVGLFQSQF
jgi:hypothetical protein